MVHRPGLEHSRLTPSNAEELLFDDVLWVARAKAEHDMFAAEKFPIWLAGRTRTGAAAMSRAAMCSRSATAP
jgi:hypothetical protein